MSLFYKQNSYGENDPAVIRIIAASIGIILILITLNIAFGPTYNVWASAKAGEAELAQAEWNRQILVRQAQAKKDAASLEADAEVARAQGVAQANKIIADGLGGPEGYLRYLYIDMLKEQNDKQIIYVPTEAGLPILEAGKR